MKISELGKTVTGKTPSTKNEKYFDGNILFITPTDITNGGYVEQTERHISEEGFNSIKTNTISGKSILVGCIGSDMGNVSWTDKTCASNQQINAITDIIDEINPIYIYYKLSQMKEYLRQLAGTTTTPILPKSIFDDIDLEIQDRNIQDKIVGILFNIDKKIENNNKINAELESMAKTIYDYWFLQFEFPNEDGKPYKSSGGKMVWNEELKREIPEGWEVNNLAKAIFKSKNGDWGNEEPVNDNDIKVNCFRGADFISITNDYQMTAPIRYIKKNNADRLLEDGDLVTEISGGSPTQATGRIGYINQGFLNRSENVMDCSNFCKAFTPIDRIYQYWLYQTWKSYYDNGAMFNYESKTTGIKNLMFDDFIDNIYVAYPNEELLEVFQNKCTLFYEKIQKNLLENQELASLRDFLLPMLMNGQVGFKNK